MLDSTFSFCYHRSGMKNSLDNLYETSLLLDFYGALLSARQQEILAFYHEENYSLQEIAAELGISRQAVHDAIKKAEKALQDYEEKLGLVARFRRQESVLEETAAALDALAGSREGDEALRTQLLRIKQNIISLEE